MKCFDKDVIRFSVIGGILVSRRIKKIVQMMALIIVVVFMTLVLYQNVYAFKNLDEVCVSIRIRIKIWQKIINYALTLYFSSFVLHLHYFINAKKKLNLFPVLSSVFTRPNIDHYIKSIGTT